MKDPQSTLEIQKKGADFHVIYIDDDADAVSINPIYQPHLLRRSEFDAHIVSDKSTDFPFMSKEILLGGYFAAKLDKKTDILTRHSLVVGNVQFKRMQ